MKVKCNFCETVLDERDVLCVGKERICPICGESVYLDNEDYGDHSEHFITKEDLKKWGVY